MLVSEEKINGRVDPLGPRYPGSHPGVDQYIIKFRTTIYVVFYE